MPCTSPEGAKLGCTTCSAIDRSLENSTGFLPLVSQHDLPAKITCRCKLCEEIFTNSIGEQQKAMSAPARCGRCRRLNRSRALDKLGGDIPKGSSEFRSREALSEALSRTSWSREALSEAQISRSASRSAREALSRTSWSRKSLKTAFSPCRAWAAVFLRCCTLLTNRKLPSWL